VSGASAGTACQTIRVRCSSSRQKSQPSPSLPMRTASRSTRALRPARDVRTFNLLTEPKSSKVPRTPPFRLPESARLQGHTTGARPKTPGELDAELTCRRSGAPWGACRSNHRRRSRCRWRKASMCPSGVQCLPSAMRLDEGFVAEVVCACAEMRSRKAPGDASARVSAIAATCIPLIPSCASRSRSRWSAGSSR
jgi:hypothetical protein